MASSSTSSAEMVRQVNGSQIANYAIVASMTILIYDYCLTLVDEINLIWNFKFNVVEILYILSRYPAFIDVTLMVFISVTPYVPINLCSSANSAIGWLLTIGISTAELILVLRTVALWARSKKVLYGLLSIFTTFFITSLVTMGIFLRRAAVLPPPYPSSIGCNIVGNSPIIIVNFVMLILFETVIMIMTTFRVYRDFKGATNPLVGTLYRDGVVFYFCLFFISLSDVLVLCLAPEEFKSLLTTLQRVMHTVLSCRIILHARQADRKLNATSLAAGRLGQHGLDSDVFTTVVMEPDVSVVLHHTGGITA